STSVVGHRPVRAPPFVGHGQALPLATEGSGEVGSRRILRHHRSCYWFGKNDGGTGHIGTSPRHVPSAQHFSRCAYYRIDESVAFTVSGSISGHAGWPHR